MTLIDHRPLAARLLKIVQEWARRNDCPQNYAIVDGMVRPQTWEDCVAQILKDFAFDLRHYYNKQTDETRSRADYAQKQADDLAVRVKELERRNTRRALSSAADEHPELWSMIRAQACAIEDARKKARAADKRAQRAHSRITLLEKKIEELTRTPTDTELLLDLQRKIRKLREQNPIPAHPTRMWPYVERLVALCREYERQLIDLRDDLLDEYRGTTTQAELQRKFEEANARLDAIANGEGCRPTGAD